jgi:hypothetical protein
MAWLRAGKAAPESAFQVPESVLLDVIAAVQIAVQFDGVDRGSGPVRLRRAVGHRHRGPLLIR